MPIFLGVVLTCARPSPEGSHPADSSLDQVSPIPDTSGLASKARRCSAVIEERAVWLTRAILLSKVAFKQLGALG